jgi:hypothetical protein
MEHSVWLKLNIMRSGIKWNAWKSLLQRSMLTESMCNADYKNINHAILD